MNDLSSQNWHLKSDAAIEKEIGLFIKQQRHQQNKTQSQLAKQANISRSTLSLLERGESGNLKTLIQVLRILGQLQVLAQMHHQKIYSPLALAKAQVQEPQRVRLSKKAHTKPSKKYPKQK